MISTKGRYALRVMLDLAEHPEADHIPLKDIAARQEISKKYLDGKGGGYRLCRRPEEYSVGEILELMEGSLATVSCLACDAAPCSRAADCQTLPMWTEYDQMTRDFFYGKKLSDLLG